MDKLGKILNLIKNAEQVAEELYEEGPTTFNHDVYSTLSTLIDTIVEERRRQ